MNNAVIMAAGTASRFAPISYEIPKALIKVRGEVLIERQIQQLKVAGIQEIIIVVGYKKELFYYLQEKFGVKIVENKEYLKRNNHSSIWAVREFLGDTFICSADNYFFENPFRIHEKESYYAAVYAEGFTDEWCMKEDDEGYICDVQVGGANAWYMLGHAFWNKEFSEKFICILSKEYELPGTEKLLWESIFIKHLSSLKMKIRRYGKEVIQEFDTLDELRKFDVSYAEKTGSQILQNIAIKLKCEEKEIINICDVKGTNNEAVGFRFTIGENLYEYLYAEKLPVKLGNLSDKI